MEDISMVTAFSLHFFTDKTSFPALTATAGAPLSTIDTGDRRAYDVDAGQS
jgi:hypothetical protein